MRLDNGTRKSNESRVVKFNAELAALLDAQRDHIDAVQKIRGAIIPHLFHRKGEAIVDLDGAWRSAL